MKTEAKNKKGVSLYQHPLYSALMWICLPQCGQVIEAPSKGCASDGEANNSDTDIPIAPAISCKVDNVGLPLI